MNATVQCLASVDALSDYYVSNAYKEDVNTTNPLGTGGNLTRECRSARCIRPCGVAT